MNFENDDISLASIYHELCAAIADLEVEQMKLDAKRDRANHMRELLAKFLRAEFRMALRSSSCSVGDDVCARIRETIDPD